MPDISESQTSLLSGHRARIRARLENDPLSVADYEVLELFLGLVIIRKDTKLLAKELIKRFGGLRGVLDARLDELEQVKGFGPALASLWCLMREIMARYAQSPFMERQRLTNSASVAVMARQRLAGMSHEESWIALVDMQNHMIAWERLVKGSISSISLQPRDVFEIAIKRKASGIILVHNHPGGSAMPSNADIELTNELRLLAPRLGLRFLDHIIVTAGDCYSMMQNQILHILEVNNE